MPYTYTSVCVYSPRNIVVALDWKTPQCTQVYSMCSYCVTLQDWYVLFIAGDSTGGEVHLYSALEACVCVVCAGVCWCHEVCVNVPIFRCGKTTVCQLLCSLMDKKLFTVNCHMYTEASDFLGGLRPARRRGDMVEEVSRCMSCGPSVL